ncbi:thiamine pyrophosphate-binding protein [Marinobacter sp. 71-i]|uniref:Thiamine pyrophosphate-binding protein n=1 Tax=Marinobacter iranensis TaxID=2962607 RepID=A0ABT5Y923_9GAMM|nr:thiamine pyrophosphate-binding protein [Marinobacter iranensis]MDF0750180.1 thiamine pyrophosphate-binding protein [Marinobacter iranensis]
MFENGDLILRYLERLGVEYVFGVPGGSIEPFYDALARSERRGGIRTITARHETGAAFMAEGYARETGRIGVCCSTAGPGATNLLTGVASAYADGIPMLVITAQTALDRFGQGSLQETSCTGIHTVEMFARCTRYNTLVSHPAQLETKLLQAVSHAVSNQPGPAHLAIPLDVMRHRIPDNVIDGALNAFTNHEVAPSERFIQSALGELDPAKKVTLVLGEGAAEASELLIRIAESRRWLMVTTPRGKGLIDSFHPLYRGVFGFAGHDSATDALKVENADRVVAIGTALDEVSTCGWDPTTILSDRLIHISNNPAHLSRSTMARLVVLGSPKVLFESLAKVWSIRPTSQASRSISSDERLPVNTRLDDPDKCFDRSGRIKSQALMTYMSRICPLDTRVLMDTGNSFLWGIHYWNVRRPTNMPPEINHFHIGLGFAAMGWAIGTSVGMAAAGRQHPVVCFTGDGSYLMSGQELTIALQENLNILMLVLNDASLGMVSHGQKLSGGEQVATRLPSVDFSMMARALGVESYRVESMEQLADLDITEILSRPGPCLVDVIVDGDQVPPLGSRMKVLTSSIQTDK